ncbi:MAG: T9SS type A sorting domain-containing protein [Saprospiraceae bacterium]
MKQLLTLLLFLVFISQIISQTRYDVKFVLEGKQRESIIVRPSTPPPIGGYPVVFMLHGTSGDGEKFYNISGWKELGEQENFITVFPSSLSWCFIEDGLEKNNTRWVNGNVTEYPCSGPAQNYVDDVRFLKVLAKAIKDTFPVNTSKIFACGFSNGCSMIHKLAVDAGDVFSALAGTSSVLSPTDSSTPVTRVPLWTMVGSLDDRFIVPPYTELPYGGDSILTYLKYHLNRVIGSQGLIPNFIKTETTNMHTYEYNESQVGQNSKRYIFSLVKDMTHEFPNGSNHPVDGPRIFWNFFKQSVTLGTKNLKILDPNIQIFPNPSSEAIHFEFLNDAEVVNLDVSIFNIQGQLIYHQTTKELNSITINKLDIGTGIFNVRIQTAKNLISKKIVFY